MANYLDYVGQGQPGPGGHYRLGVKTGLTTIIAAAGAILSLRWTSTSYFFVLLDLQATCTVTTAATTAQLMDLNLFVNRSFTAAPSGGTSIIPFAIPNTGRMRDVGGGMQPSQITNLQVATTAALTAGTRVQDSNAIGYCAFNAIALGSSDTRSLYQVTPGQDHACVLGANEGLEIGIGTTQGAVGVFVYGFNIRWLETPAY